MFFYLQNIGEFRFMILKTTMDEIRNKKGFSKTSFILSQLFQPADTQVNVVKDTSFTDVSHVAFTRQYV